MSCGIITHVERNCILHEKRVSNNNLVIIRLFTTYTSQGRDLNNGEQQVGGYEKN